MTPNLSRNFLLGLVAVVIIVGFGTAVAIGSGWYRSVANQSSAPTVMILSRETLRAGIEINIKDANGLGPAILATAKQQSDDASGKAQPEPAGTAKNKESQLQEAKSLSVVALTIEDQLGGAIEQALGNSGRFQPIAAGQVSEQLANARSSGQISNTRPVFGFQNRKVEASGKAETTQTTVVKEPAQDGIKRMASNLGADYTMIVSVGAPNLVYELVRADDVQPARVVFSAQPTIACELYSNKGKLAYRFQKQFDKRISVTVPIDSQTPFMGNLVIAYQKVNEKVSEAAAQEILAWALDKVAPAKVMKAGNKLVINRGSNDGVHSGAIYQVLRETGDAVVEGGDNNGRGGVDLGRVRQPVGSLVIQSVQERISIAKLASGGQILKGDIVEIVASPNAYSDTNPGSPDAAPGGTPLGEQALGQEAARSSGVALRQASVAVDSISLNGQMSSGTAQMVSDALSADPRITVLPRAQLGAILSERRLNTASTGDYEAAGLQGMRTSGYLISGQFSTSTSRHANTVSVGGISQTVSTSSSTSVSGVLRATSVDGKLIQTVRVSGQGSVPAAAQAAARDMLLALFPIKIVQVSGSNIYINRGADGGLRAGTHLKIFHLGAPIVDKQTGALLSAGARTLAGEAVVSDVDTNVSTAQLVGSPAIAEGDLVQIGGSVAAPAKTAAAHGKPAQKVVKAKPRPNGDSQDKGLHF